MLKTTRESAPATKPLTDEQQWFMQAYTDDPGFGKPWKVYDFGRGYVHLQMHGVALILMEDGRWFMKDTSGA